MEKKLLKDSFVINALRKQVPQKVAKTPYFYGCIYGCPYCDIFISPVKNSTIKYCDHCGQALDWSEV